MFNRKDLEALAKPQQGPCVSIYLTADAGSGNPDKHAIRLKNLIRDAQHQMSNSPMRSVEVKRLLAPAFELVENEFFWRSQSGGVALFLSQDQGKIFSESFRFSPRALVSSQFYLIPMVALLGETHDFYLLALSQKKVRLYKDSGDEVDELDLGDAPESMEEVLVYEEPLKQLQYHSGAPRGRSGSTAVFHGQGVGTDDNKDRIHRFLQQVDSGISSILKNESAPLVLAGVDYILPMYRRVNTYPHLVEQGIVGNPDGIDAEVLAGEAREILAPTFRKPLEEALERYGAAVGNGLASDDLGEIAAAALQGRVKTLIVSKDREVWAKVQDFEMGVDVHGARQNGDVELLNLCATRTMGSGGSVLVVPQDVLPTDGASVAFFRY